MASTAAAATVWNAVNYVGELYTIGANQTPFLNMIGGLSGGGKSVKSWEFALAQTDALDSATQPNITETASLTAPTAATYTRTQDKNVCQIYQSQVSVSYAKQSNAATLSGLALAGENQPVQNEKDYQISRHLRQISINAEYTFLQGTYNLATTAGTANRTRGMKNAITTNTVAAGSVALSKSLVNQLLREMAANGSKFANVVAFCNAFQKQGLTDVYGYAPESRNVGGMNIKQIETDFCQLGVVWAPQMPTDELYICEMSVIRPVFLPVPDKGYLFYEELSKTGAAESGQIYGQIGLDYGPEEYHASITGLTTS